MKILITGCNGMLGYDLIKLLKAEPRFTLLCIDITKSAGDVSYCDICDFQSLKFFFESFLPDVIIHLAAETDLEKCELQPRHAEKIHILGTDHIIALCKKYIIPLVHVSTASIFDGSNEDGYFENDIPNPLNVYGKTKLEAELNVRKALSSYFVIRPAWMFGGMEKDKKFVGKIIKQIEAGTEILAVNDMTGNLSYTMDVARTIIFLLGTKKFGIYHAINEGIVSRYDIAKKIVSLYDDPVRVTSVSSTSFTSNVIRPLNECLRNKNLFSLQEKKLPTWDYSLTKYIFRYIKSNESEKTHIAY